MSSNPWYDEGLRFECTQCGDCCTGSAGYVWVNKAEIEALAAQRGLDIEEFERRFVRRVGVRKCLLERPNGDCVLFDRETRKCTTYHARPRQCRSWPFWRSNVRTVNDWQETCRVCPGSGKGELVPLEEILDSVAAIRI